MVLDWLEGQPFSSRFGDVYFSSDSGLEETRYMFLQGNRLAERFALLSAGESFCIGETGFGTGLNFLCAWQLFEQTAPAGASLDFFSVEKFPLSDDELQAAMALWPELHVQAELLLSRWHRRVPGWNRWNLAGGRVRLTLAIGDVDVALPQLPETSVDAWFLDGFSPAKNPDMWSEVVLANIARASCNGATLATYTSAGWVRRGLQDAGFEVDKVQGFGRKREMVRGALVRGDFTPSPALPRGERELKRSAEMSSGFSFPLPSGESWGGGRLREGVSLPQSSTRNKTPRTALIIGGGIAGCAAAHALAQRGIAVTLIERTTQLANGASGNPRGILHARFGAGDNPLHRFVLAAYGHALGLFDQVLPVDGTVRAECGLLQLACNEVETKRIGRLQEQDWPEHLLQFVDAAKATQLAGAEMNYGGLWFPAGGWIVPPKLCAKLASHVHITQRLGHEVAILEKSDIGWRVSGTNTQGFKWEAEADVALVCSAHSAKKFSQFAHFSLRPVRGQITEVPQTQASKALQSVVCGDGYFSPELGGVHVIGATHAFDDESIEVRFTDHAENMAKLEEYAPQLFRALGETKEKNLTGRASIRCSAPGSMPLVGEVQEGLYCSLAHGTRGLLTAGLAAEVLAAKICGQLPPLPSSIIDALAPLRRVRHKA
jgi:tRNA 5-methylaminomethyl-2-thiouridine biosynthesis bifunctional protein